MTTLEATRPAAEPEDVGPCPRRSEAFFEPSNVATADTVLSQLTDVGREMDALRQEVEHLRQRDTAVQGYLHRIDEELRLAGRLQGDFLPRNLPEVGPVRFHTLWRPCGYVSGDLYDVCRLDEHHVSFYVADAVGHGMPAALLTMFLRQALVMKLITGDTYQILEPGQAMSRLNTALMDQQLTAGTFGTAFYGLIDTRTLELRFASAGHPSPLLLRAYQEPIPLRVEGPLLGVFEETGYPTASIQLQPSDRLVAFTDGIDVTLPDDSADNARWKAELASRCGKPGATLLAELADLLDVASGSLNPRDDLTLVVAEVLG